MLDLCGDFRFLTRKNKTKTLTFQYSVSTQELAAFTDKDEFFVFIKEANMTFISFGHCLAMFDLNSKCIKLARLLSHHHWLNLEVTPCFFFPWGHNS